ncbi:MAG TPA: JDVT-CTERM domain-containing protein, partial [Candidatus Brocadiia bacterium]|nr:JDVT-CTERM domain-containing protein [Candidatus Brocadiia bacterium]
QTLPALVLDERDQPLVIFAQAGKDIYGAGAQAYTNARTLDVDAAAGGSLAPNATQPGIDVPANSTAMNVEITIGELVNPPQPPAHSIGVPYVFLPSGLTFAQPVTISIPVTVAQMAGLAAPYHVYWYDEALEQWSEEGISDVQYDSVNHLLTFKTTHFTGFWPGGSVAGGGGGGGGGGCSMSGSAPSDWTLLLLPYVAALALLMRRAVRARR